MKSSIPYGLGVRIKRNCSEESAYKIQKNDMKKNLCKQGYTKRSIDNELKKVDKLDRNTILQYRTDKSKTDRVPLVLTYLKGLPHVREIIKKKIDSIAQVGENEKSVHKTTNFSIQTRSEFKRYFSSQKA
jgi:3-hydroxyisobutyrate dehydrogenase-like beta-hydroxyacid dehydrogenase